MDELAENPAGLETLFAQSTGDCFGEEWLQCCDESVCCQAHNPALLSCDICAAGWTAQEPGATLEGSTVNNACCIGGLWQFDGSTTVTFTGPATCIDTIVIMGHNVDSVNTPFGSASGTCESFNCMGPQSVPIVIHDYEANDPVTGACSEYTTFTIQLNGTGPQCIDRIFIGQKMYFPEGVLSMDYQNIFTGSDCSVEVKMSECCTPLAATVKREPISLDLSLICAPEWYVKQRWLPFMRFACRHGVCFMPSVNRCPEQVFCGWFESTQGGSTYSDPWRQTLTLSATGFISNPQPKGI